MASAAPTNLDDGLTCSVCHEHFSTPKLLPCGHLLCVHCLLSWLQSQKDAGCPLCRSPIVEAENGGGSGSLEDVCDSFPTELSMVQLVEAERVLKKQHQCYGCKETVATHLCLNCQDMMCKACAKIHGNFSISKNHVIEELSTLTPEKLAAGHNSETCAHHKDQTCNLYCPTHDESLCHVCAMTRHRSCQEVKELEETMKESRVLLDDLVKRLTEGQRALTNSIQELDQHIDDTEKNSQTLTQEIDDLRDRLFSAVNKRCGDLKEQVLGACSEVKTAANDGKTHLLQRNGKLTCHKAVSERVCAMKGREDVKTMSAVMKSRVEGMDLTSDLPADFTVISAVTLEVGADVVSSVEKMLQDVGKVKCAPADLKAQPKVVTWSFHNNHGTGITLSNNDQTADRVPGTSTSNGIVMSRDPMEMDRLYQVELNEDMPNWNYTHNRLGVSLESPDNLTLPVNVHQGSPFKAVLINFNCIYHQLTRMASTLGAPLQSLRAGGRMGLLVDGKRDVHLYVNDKDLGVFANNVPHPCFLLIDLLACWKKVTTLPLKKVK